MNAILHQKIQRLKEEVKFLDDNKTRFLCTIKTSGDTKKIVERCAYLCAEIALDVADVAIVSRNLPKPETYREAIYKLGEHQIIPPVFAHCFAYIAGLRYHLEHDYMRDTVPPLVDFLDHKLEDIKKYITFMEK